jgi:hypothetical protein
MPGNAFFRSVLHANTPGGRPLSITGRNRRPVDADTFLPADDNAIRRPPLSRS